METLKLASFETNRKSGDGSSSSLIMTTHLLNGANKYLKENNITKVELRDIIEEAKNKCLELLHNKYSKEIKEEEYEYIAKVSLGSDKYASLISNTYRFLDRGLRPSIVRADITDVVSEEKDGIVLDKSEVLLSQEELSKGAKEYNDLDVYCIYDKLDRWQQIQPIIEQMIRCKRQCVLFYNELSIDILQNIQLQNLKGYSDIIPVHLGTYGVQTKSIMDQLSIYTNATLIDGLEFKLPRNLKDLIIGKLDYMIVSGETVVLNNKDFVERDKITLPTKSVLIRIGGNNSSEREENYRRIEDAVNSLGNALESGIVLGGGITYYNISNDLSEETPMFIKDSLRSIYRKVVSNQLGSNDIPEDKVCLLPKGDNWYSADELNVFDATKVLEQVITNSFSLVAQLVTTEVIIAENIR